MEDPMFTRRGSDGKLIRTEELMPPAEILVNKRILQINRNIACTYEDAQPRGLADIISEALLCLDSMSHEPIKLIISCPGGTMYAAFALYDAIKATESPIWTFGRVCMSNGALLLAAGERGRRYIYPNTFAMLHLVQVTTTVESTRDSQTEKIRNAHLQAVKDRMVQLYIDCGVNRTAKQINKDIDRELYLNADEIVEYGLADKVIRGGYLLDGE